MNGISALSVLLIILFYGNAHSQSSQLVAAAAKEGALKFYGPSTLTHDGVQLLAQAFNKKHGTNIKVTYYPSKSMTAEVNKMIGLSATAIEPEYDVMAIIDGLHGALRTKSSMYLLITRRLGSILKPFTSIRAQFRSPTRSFCRAITQINLAAHDVPKRVGRLARSKMEGAQNRYPNRHRPNGLLGNQMGRASFIQFATELAKREPIPGRLGELYTRLQIGEIVIASTLIDSFVNLAEKTAPG